ncbi:hypothetical protein [Pelosinus fermentans]|uniref:Uncharacterized protein n=1 Tax=Pelosinus fermentans JBW45 TaxID=1192197 RepID=I9NLJ0_9FIRM|nr:hypothetical protein [Pelosinus fermentans]AJQ29507.1 hypothetical protein JBW_04176 [Pelosinus fermentans JBW45]
MSENRYTLTVYIAPPFSDESKVGHMWISLDDHQKGLEEHYGFQPSEPDHAFTKNGRVVTDDPYHYKIRATQESFPITAETYSKVREYCQQTLLGSFGSYIGIGNSCVDYVEAAMREAGIAEQQITFLGHTARLSGVKLHAFPIVNHFGVEILSGRHKTQWDEQNKEPDEYEKAKSMFESEWGKQNFPW